MQIIDEVVSREKFLFEIDTFKKIADTQSKRGVLMLKAEFPNVVIAFAATRLKPSPIVFAVRINFNNYDLEAPSVRFIDPFTGENLLQPPPMLRKVTLKDKPSEIQALSMKDTIGLPFICIPGIREYHIHPAHTGDFWLLHRKKGGEGTLGFIIDKLYEYGISAI